MIAADRIRAENALRKEMNLTHAEFERVMKQGGERYLLPPRKNRYDELPREEGTYRERRLRFLKRMVSAIKKRGWYRWEPLSWKD